MNTELDSYISSINEVMNELAPVWMPHEGQLPIIRDLLFNFMIGVFVQCGRKFGKTELAIYVCYIIAILIPNAEIYYVADEKDHAREICWDNGRLPYFFTKFKQNENESEDSYRNRLKYGRKLERKYIASINNQTMSVKFKNGSIIKVEGAKNFSKADGLSPHFLVYDEFKSHDPKYDQAMRPNLKTHNGRILIIGTPPSDEDTYYCETAREFQTRNKHKYYKMPSYTNPYVYKGKEDPRLKEDEEIAKSKSEWHIFAREYLAEITPDLTKTIFPMYDEKKHVLPHERILQELEVKGDWNFHLHFDPGTTSTFAVLMVAINKYNKRVLLIDEIYEQRMMYTTTKVIWPSAVLKCKQIYSKFDRWRKGYDLAAAWFHVEVATEFNEGLIPCDKFSKSKEDMLSMIKDMMLSNSFYISDRCEHTRKEIKKYSKDENGNIQTDNDHNIDNLRYILAAEGYVSNIKNVLPPLTSERRAYSIEEDLKEQPLMDLDEAEMLDPYAEITDEFYQ